ncbi:hypothetical protein FDF11_14100 [Clostridium botulinum]|nr:hypothetical protein [Clostridium botulinum]NFR15729.1 hypothetical protein [Clostridium botulinum]NFR44882.1 hypothetical protein [Clostridium botulinum]NFS51764.1 hypothetical protein [Clostridium botulinum]
MPYPLHLILRLKCNISINILNLFNIILLVLCITDVVLCSLIYLIILLITKDKVLYHLSNKLLCKFNILKRPI